MASTSGLEADQGEGGEARASIHELEMGSDAPWPPSQGLPIDDDNHSMTSSHAYEDASSNKASCKNIKSQLPADLQSADPPTAFQRTRSNSRQDSSDQQMTNTDYDVISIRPDSAGLSPEDAAAVVGMVNAASESRPVRLSTVLQSRSNSRPASQGSPLHTSRRQGRMSVTNVDHTDIEGVVKAEDMPEYRQVPGLQQLAMLSRGSSTHVSSSRSFQPPHPASQVHMPDLVSAEDAAVLNEQNADAHLTMMAPSPHASPRSSQTGQAADQGQSGPVPGSLLAGNAPETGRPSSGGSTRPLSGKLLAPLQGRPNSGSAAGSKRSSQTIDMALASSGKAAAVPALPPAIPIPRSRPHSSAYPSPLHYGKAPEGVLGHSLNSGRRSEAEPALQPADSSIHDNDVPVSAGRPNSGQGTQRNYVTSQAAHGTPATTTQPQEDIPISQNNSTKASVGGSRPGTASKQAQQQSPHSSSRPPSMPDFVPDELQGIDLNIPMHLIDPEYAGSGPGTPYSPNAYVHVQQQPLFRPNSGGDAARMTDGSPGSPGRLFAPPKKLHGCVARPFVERTGAMPTASMSRSHTGHVVKTAGRHHKGSAGHGTGPTAFMSSSNRDGSAGPDHKASIGPIREEQAHKGRVKPTQGRSDICDASQSKTQLGEFMFVKSMLKDSHGQPTEAHLGMGELRGKARRTGRINFRGARALPASIAPGASGLSAEQIKQGLARRMLAAERHMFGVAPYQRQHDPRPPTPEAIMLDGFMLLDAGDDEYPEGVIAARLSGRNIGSVEQADLTYFEQLRVLDMSDNAMTGMAVLGNLRSLQALSLSLNHMTSVGRWKQGVAFMDLVTLDLSYNQLPGEEVFGRDSLLAALPGLRELNMSCNQLTSLPQEMGPFEALELLKLAGNKLSGKALLALARLPALHTLSLAKNKTFTGLEPDDMDVVHFAIAFQRHQQEKEATQAATEDGQVGSEDSKSSQTNGRGSSIDAKHDDSAAQRAARFFPSLQVLDVSDCGIREQASMEPLRSLPQITTILLDGNPLATQLVLSHRREKQKRTRAFMLAQDGAVLPADALQQPRSDPLFKWQKPQLQGSKPTVADVVTGKFGRLFVVADTLQPRDAEKAAAMAAVAAVPQEAVGAAFERVDSLIEAWQLSTVVEGDEEGSYEGDIEEGDEEQDDDDHDHESVEDHTFLTGVGITEKQPKHRVKQVHDTGALPDDDDRPLWEDVSDPTERLAIALGLDPKRLAMFTGRPTQDAMSAINALRFALAHPCVEADEGMCVHKPQHLALTAAAKAKRRQAPTKLQPLPTSQAPSSTTHGVDTKTIKIQTVESMLGSMKHRLAALETSLATKLAALPSEHAGEGTGLKSRMSLASRASMDTVVGTAGAAHAASVPVLQPSQPAAQPVVGMGNFLQNLQPLQLVAVESGEPGEEPPVGSPDILPRPTSPFQLRVLPYDGGMDSDHSSLPEDVIDAIENSDPSEDEQDMNMMLAALESGDNSVAATPRATADVLPGQLQLQQAVSGSVNNRLGSPHGQNTDVRRNSPGSPKSSRLRSASPRPRIHSASQKVRDEGAAVGRRPGSGTTRK